jgi:hypothetical protein
MRFAPAFTFSLLLALSGVHAIASDGLRVEVRSPAQFKIGEEPDLEISLINSSNTSLRIRDFANYRHWMFQHVHFVTLRNGQEEPGPNGALLDPSMKPPSESEWRRLLPGETMTFHTHHDLGIGLGALSPGDHTVEIRVYADEDGHYVSSNPFNIRVVP